MQLAGDVKGAAFGSGPPWVCSVHVAFVPEECAFCISLVSALRLGKQRNRQPSGMQEGITFGPSDCIVTYFDWRGIMSDSFQARKCFGDVSNPV